ncbi:hypothetical protein D8T43_19605, partial [Vibrio vulnificus]
GFLQTPPLASDALAIRIVFPLVRVTPFSFKWTGLPALLGKQQNLEKLQVCRELGINLRPLSLIANHRKAPA